MKIKVLTIFIISRILDLITTYFSYNGSLEFETSLLVRLFHFDWIGLVLFNLIIILLLYILIFKVYSEKRIISNEIRFKERIYSFSDYFSFIYYKRKISFKDLLISNDFDSKIFIYSFIITLPLTISIISIIASINNILVMKSEGLFYFINQNQIIIVIIIIMMIIQLLMFYFYNFIRFKNLKN